MSQYTWVETHKKIVDYLKTQQNNQKELIQLLRDIGIKNLTDTDANGNSIEMDEIDPFTFFFCIHSFKKQRVEMLKQLSKNLKLGTEPTDDFGIPSVIPQNVWLFPRKAERNNDEIANLWILFNKAIDDKIDDEIFATVLNIKNIGPSKLTEALFMVSPEKYFPIDKPTEPYLKEHLSIDPKFKTFSEYKLILEKLKNINPKKFYEISYEAWQINGSITTNTDNSIFQKGNSAQISPKTITNQNVKNENNPDFNKKASKFSFDFQTALKAFGLKFSDKLVNRFIASLLSKQFVILTGLSGSGKTKLAQAFAQWICKSDVQTLSDNIVEINLPLNKSAIKHRGWTLPKNFKKNFGESNKIPVEVEIEIAGKKVSAHIETMHRLFYDKQLTLAADDSNIEVPVKIEFKNQAASGNVFSQQYCIVPVGADWTNREPLLGYPNALKKEEYIKPDNGVLDLIINANQNPELPYFLILDEMNLSHVERYFADFLSVMESKDYIQLYSGTSENGVPGKISLPDNLFIIGTVNVDETTYMFSPKVLDRANTIEFRVEKEDMIDFLDNLSNIDINKIIGKGSSMGESFLELAATNVVEEIDAETKNSLMSFFNQLKKVGAEFGYRSATEMIKLIGKLSLIDSGLSDNEKLDIAIMQKLLPKLHGSRRKLCPILSKIGNFCVTEKIDKVEKQVFESDEFDFNSKDVKFPLSLEKISRMYRCAIDNGFASYAEA